MAELELVGGPLQWRANSNSAGSRHCRFGAKYDEHKHRRGRPACPDAPRAFGATSPGGRFASGRGFGRWRHGGCKRAGRFSPHARRRDNGARRTGAGLELSTWAPWRLAERGTEWILEPKSELLKLLSGVRGFPIKEPMLSEEHKAVLLVVLGYRRKGGVTKTRVGTILGLEASTTWLIFPGRA